MNEEIKKRVDDNWKNQIDQEKAKAKDENLAYHQPTFSIFLSSLSMQAMIAMGKLQNPVTKQIERNLEQARFLVDTIAIIQDKTKGNLTSEEQALLDESLFNLRMMYVDEKEKK